MPLIPFSSHTPIPSRSSYIPVHSRSHSAPVSDASSYAPLRVTSAKLIPGVMSEPPPGWIEKHRRYCASPLRDSRAVTRLRLGNNLTSAIYLLRP